MRRASVERDHVFFLQSRVLSAGCTIRRLIFGANMLYSRSMDLGFAHYPKTAGHSITKWFREVFPDARLVEPHPLYEVNHLPVRDSLEKLGLVPRRVDHPRKMRRGLARAYEKLVKQTACWMPFAHTDGAADRTPCGTRIIGVLREPFEMLVSLFQYWQSYDFEQEPIQPLIVCARTGSFREFLRMAVVDRVFINYEDFFDVHGPARSTMRLLDFNSLEPALMTVCREFGIDVPNSKLGLLNIGPSRLRDLESYRREAGTLVSEVESHFRWYYEEGIHLMVKGPVGAEPHRQAA